MDATQVLNYIIPVPSISMLYSEDKIAITVQFLRTKLSSNYKGLTSVFIFFIVMDYGTSFYHLMSTL